MHPIVAPAALLMSRLRLLPKFGLLAIIVLAPLCIVCALLFNEISRNIESAARERRGLERIEALQHAMQRLLRHRGERHLALAGLAASGKNIQALQASLGEALGQAARAAEDFGLASEADALRKAWQALPRQDDAPASYAAHEHLLAQLGALVRTIADDSGVTMDPGADSHHLALAAVQTLPEIARNLAHIAARGASYIDTGLMEANEDVVLQSTVQVARRDLERAPEQFEAAFARNPSLRARLAAHHAALDGALAFLERAENEVLRSLDQTSGRDFLDAGQHAADGLLAAAEATRSVVDALLRARIAQEEARRRLIVLGVLLSLAVTVWLAAGFYVSFSRELGRLSRAVERVAGGDLGTRIVSVARDEVGELVNAFARMSAQLAQLVRSVRGGSGAVNVASARILSDSMDLSARTEEQAGALERTSVSLQAFAASARRNSESAAQASALAENAARVAERGGATVREVVGTMGAIRAGSREIIDIIRLIDEIAFQTNILALNAAVEAARAGTQGRGFAVVAAQVRALAQRSADAAGDIKGLIEGAVARVNTGAQLADDAGATMQDIIASVRRVEAIMAEIAAASHEQRGGIEQISQAMGQLDDATRRNASMAEHAADAVADLQQQAGQLSDAVAAFRLEQEDEEGEGEGMEAEGARPSCTRMARLPSPRADVEARQALDKEALVRAV